MISIFYKCRLNKFLSLTFLAKNTFRGVTCRKGPLSRVWYGKVTTFQGMVWESGHFPRTIKKIIAYHSKKLAKCPCFIKVFFQDLWPIAFRVPYPGK